ncbi:MAG: hypothetical protein PF692_15155 [Kiritimatiellae bacterium]|jgi:hypothetical protein|nr:hypothetical protein [Kiritimatiellia bacterium]
MWYLKLNEDKTYGPITKPNLIKWAFDGRIPPNSKVAQNEQCWFLAETMPELEINWHIQLLDETIYGPVNISSIKPMLVDNLIDWSCVAYSNSYPTGIMLGEIQNMVNSPIPRIAHKDKKIKIQFDNLRKMNSNFSKSLAQKDLQIKDLTEQINTLSSQAAETNNTQSTQNEQQQSEKTSLEKKCQKIEDDNTRLITKKETLVAKLTQIETSLDNEKAQVKELSLKAQEVDKQQTLIENQNTDIQQLNKIIQEHKLKLEEVEKLLLQEQQISKGKVDELEKTRLLLKNNKELINKNDSEKQKLIEELQKQIAQAKDDGKKQDELILQKETLIDDKEKVAQEHKLKLEKVEKRLLQEQQISKGKVDELEETRLLLKNNKDLISKNDSEKEQLIEELQKQIAQAKDDVKKQDELILQKETLITDKEKVAQEHKLQLEEVEKLLLQEQQISKGKVDELEKTRLLLKNNKDLISKNDAEKQQLIEELQKQIAGAKDDVSKDLEQHKAKYNDLEQENLKIIEDQNLLKQKQAQILSDNLNFTKKIGEICHKLSSTNNKNSLLTKKVEQLSQLLKAERLKTTQSRHADNTSAATDPKVQRNISSQKLSSYLEPEEETTQQEKRAWKFPLKKH